MQFKPTSGVASELNSPCIIIPCASTLDSFSTAAQIDQASQGYLSEIINSGDFEWQACQYLNAAESTRH